MILFLLLVVVVLWWATLWLALPIDWDTLTLPNLVLWHVVPPLALVLAWGVGKHLRAWRTTRRERLAKEAKEAEEKQAQEAALAAHRQALEARRASIECRGVWASLSMLPEWNENPVDSCILLEQHADTVRSLGREGAVKKSLQHVFEAAFAQAEALAWLPVFIFSKDSYPGAVEQDHCTLAWKRAVEACQSRDVFQSLCPPSSLECGFLPGVGDIVNRSLALFEQDPYLPAFLLLGFDSPLAEMLEWDDFDFSAPKPNHAVVALLVARPGLVAAAAESLPLSPGGKEVDPNLVPYWERPAVRVDAPSAWGRMPACLQPGFLEKLPPLAALTRPRSAAAAERESTCVHRIQQAIEEAFIDAGLRDLAFAGEGGAQVKQGEDEIAPEIGWAVFDGFAENRRCQIATALVECRSDLEFVAQSTHARNELGDAGAANGVLMQALAFIRAGQLEKPVLLTEAFDKGGIGVSLVRPCVVVGFS